MKSYFVIKKWYYKFGWYYYSGNKPTTSTFSDNITKAILYSDFDGAEEILKKISTHAVGDIFSIEKIYMKR